MTGSNWVTFFGTPIPSIFSFTDCLRHSAHFPWLRPESDSGLLRSSTPLPKAEPIYSNFIKAREMGISLDMLTTFSKLVLEEFLCIVDGSMSDISTKWHHVVYTVYALEHAICPLTGIDIIQSLTQNRKISYLY